MGLMRLGYLLLVFFACASDALTVRISSEIPLQTDSVEVEFIIEPLTVKRRDLAMPPGEP